MERREQQQPGPSRNGEAERREEPVMMICARCRKPCTPGDQERYLIEFGLCYWCAHVDAEG